MPELPNDKDMPFLEHLIELRSRLLKIVATVVVLFLALTPFANDLFTMLAKPLLKFMPENSQMIAIDVISPFLTPFKLTLIIAIFLMIPVILYHIWAFVAPGLYQHEKRLILPLIVSSTLLFICGMVFAYYLILPLVFGFMVSTTPQGVAMMTDINRYLDFVLTMFFSFGAAFQVPVATVVLVWIGAVTPDQLAAKRPYIIVAAFTIGMVITPPDVISQTLLAVPMWLLFEAGLLFARFIMMRKGRISTTDMTVVDSKKDIQRQ